jgi:hypothetical protein
MNHTRIYVFLGNPSSLVDMMASMDTVQLFSKGEYLVIFVDMLTYSPRYRNSEQVRSNLKEILINISVLTLQRSSKIFVETRSTIEVVLSSGKLYKASP